MRELFSAENMQLSKTPSTAPAAGVLLRELVRMELVQRGQLRVN